MTFLKVSGRKLNQVLRRQNAAEIDALCEHMSAARTEQLAALNQDTFKGLFPVQIAAKYNNARIVRMLVEAGANPESMSQAGIPTLLFALGFFDDDDNGGGVEVTKCLVEELHVNVNAQYISPTWQPPNRNNIFDVLISHGTITTLLSALMCAELYSSPEMVALLLQHGADAALTDAEGQTAMHYCARRSGDDSDTVLKILLNSGADFQVCDAYGRTPLDASNYFALRGREPIRLALRIRVTAGLRAALGLPITGQAWAGMNNDADPFTSTKQEMFIRHFQEFVMEQHGNLSAHWLLGGAEYNSNGHCVKLSLGTLTIKQMTTLLKQMGSENPKFVTVTDDTGATPLHVACHSPGTPLSVLQSLFEMAPATIHSRDLEGNLPLHAACRTAGTPLEVLHFLLEKVPATIRSRDFEGNLPLHTLCSTKPSLEKFQYILQAWRGATAVPRTQASYRLWLRARRMPRWM